MKQIPQPTKLCYDAILAQQHIPKKLRPYYLKWLRYYSGNKKPRSHNEIGVLFQTNHVHPPLRV